MCFTCDRQATGLDWQYPPTRVKWTLFPLSCCWGNRTETDAVQFQIYSSDYDTAREIWLIQTQDVVRVIYTLRVFALKSIPEKPWINTFPYFPLSCIFLIAHETVVRGSSLWALCYISSLCLAIPTRWLFSKRVTDRQYSFAFNLSQHQRVLLWPGSGTNLQKFLSDASLRLEMHCRVVTVT